MGLNQTPSGERLHIAFFGMRNAGKSSLVNAVTGQKLSLVSEIRGTTTDPVRKAMELLPIGPVVIIDTPGLDDTGELGTMRAERARKTLSETDLAVLVVDATVGLSQMDKELLALFGERKIPYVIAWNKADLLAERPKQSGKAMYVSAVTGENIHEFKELLGSFAKKGSGKVILTDLLEPDDIVVVVIPVDEAAPKGRLILPQQQTIRELLDFHGIVVCCQPQELPRMFQSLAVKPKLVVTDSQAFGMVSKLVPEDIMLTSFSVLFARYKGILPVLIEGVAALEKLQDGDKVLISEGCTHHRQCGDIGSVKIPNWIREFTGAEPEFHFTSGMEFTGNPEEYKLVIHCGGCMLNETEMKSRIEMAVKAGVPIANYGLSIAHMHGLLLRSLRPFGDAAKLGTVLLHPLCVPNNFMNRDKRDNLTAVST